MVKVDSAEINDQIVGAAGAAHAVYRLHRDAQGINTASASVRTVVGI
jgi:hypothetical protein